jgi:hypothetical protein
MTSRRTSECFDALYRILVRRRDNVAHFRRGIQRKVVSLNGRRRYVNDVTTGLVNHDHSSKTRKGCRAAKSTYHYFDPTPFPLGDPKYTSHFHSLGPSSQLPFHDTEDIGLGT